MKQTFQVDKANLTGLLTNYTDIEDKFLNTAHFEVVIPTDPEIQGDPDCVFRDFLALHAGYGEVQDTNGSEVSPDYLAHVDSSGKLVFEYVHYETDFATKGFIEELRMAVKGYVHEDPLNPPHLCLTVTELTW